MSSLLKDKKYLLSILGMVLILLVFLLFSSGIIEISNKDAKIGAISTYINKQPIFSYYIDNTIIMTIIYQGNYDFKDILRRSEYNFSRGNSREDVIWGKISDKANWQIKSNNLEECIINGKKYNIKEKNIFIIDAEGKVEATDFYNGEPGKPLLDKCRTIIENR